jgi:hypothetical protein
MHLFIRQILSEYWMPTTISDTGNIPVDRHSPSCCCYKPYI